MDSGYWIVVVDISVLTRKYFDEKNSSLREGCYNGARVCDCNIVTIVIPPFWRMFVTDNGFALIEINTWSPTATTFFGWNLKPFDSFLLVLFKFPPVWPDGKVRLMCSLLREKWKEAPTPLWDVRLLVCMWSPEPRATDLVTEGAALQLNNK